MRPRSRTRPLRALAPLVAVALGFTVLAVALADGGGDAGGGGGHGYTYHDDGQHPQRREYEATAESVPGGAGAQAVIGSDDRTRITNTTAAPWRSIAYLEIYGLYSAGSCTGTFIGPNAVLTAAHCLYDADEGWMTDIAVVPGKNAAVEPYGYQWAANWWVPDGWIMTGSPAFDWGIIKLPNSNLGNTVGWFQLGVLSTVTLAAPDFQPAIVGYPGDVLPSHSMWGSIAAAFFSVGQTTLFHTIDTYPGESGAAVFSANLNSPYLAMIVGIHNGSSVVQGVTINDAKRMTGAVLADILEGCAVMGCSIDYYIEPSGGPTPSPSPSPSPIPTPSRSPSPSPSPAKSVAPSPSPSPAPGSGARPFRRTAAFLVHN